MVEEPLKVQVEEVSQVERKLSIEVPSAAIQKLLDAAYANLARTVRLPGFRPGKVPRRILEQKYRDQVENQVVRDLTQNAYLEALELHNVPAVSSPSITDGGRLKKGEPFTFHAQVQVRPKVSPTDYDGLQLTRREATVTDEQVDKRLEEIRQRMAKLVPVEGRDAGRPGDFATVDYVATIDGADFPGSQATGVKVEIAPGELAHSKLAALEGVKVGETKAIDYAFPPDYQVEEVKGKTARFQITVRELKAQVTPELNDEFAREIGGGQTLAEMREKVRGDLLAAERARVRQADRDELLADLLKRNPFEVPSAMVTRAVDGMVQSVLRNIARAGVDPSALRLDPDALRTELQEKAATEVKATLALEAIGLKEGVDVDEAAVEARAQELARETGNTVDQVRHALEDPATKRQFYEKLREEKTIELLKARAKYS